LSSAVDFAFELTLFRLMLARWTPICASSTEKPASTTLLFMSCNCRAASRASLDEVKLRLHRASALGLREFRLGLRPTCRAAS
jgi:hypothetical protein